MISKQDFWNWFKKNEAKFYFLNQIENPLEKENILDAFEKKLHQYCNHFSFEIGGFPNGIQELIISSNGNSKYFEKIVNFISEAPEIPNWNIIAFKQPNYEDFTTELKEIKVNANETWFTPLSNPKHPKDLGLRIAFNNYDLKKRDLFERIARIILETRLGEVNFSYVKYIDTIGLPNTQANQDDYFEFESITDYFSWYFDSKRLR